MVSTAQKHASEPRPRGVPRPDLVFFVAVCLGWIALSQWLSFSGLIAVLGLVYVGLNARLISVALFDVPPRRRRATDFPELTLIVATHDDEGTIEQTLDRARRQRYPGELRILVADADSTDETVERASRCAEHDLRIAVRRFPHEAKSRTSSERSPPSVPRWSPRSTPARCFGPGRSGSAPVACSRPPSRRSRSAAAVFVSTARENLLAQAEEWDRRLGVAPPRQPHDDFRGPLMTEDDFTVMRTGAARELTGSAAG